MKVELFVTAEVGGYKNVKIVGFIERGLDFVPVLETEPAVDSKGPDPEQPNILV